MLLIQGPAPVITKNLEPVHKHSLLSGLESTKRPITGHGVFFALRCQIKLYVLIDGTLTFKHHMVNYAFKYYVVAVFDRPGGWFVISFLPVTSSEI